jgi:hypothetical protein
MRVSAYYDPVPMAGWSYRLLIVSCFTDTGCCKGIELFEKGFVVNIVLAVGGKGHADHAIDQVDRAIAQVGGFIRSA